jgi:Holliday junction resolvase RusA-like endonuclease
MPIRVKPRPRTTQNGHVYMPADYMTWKRTIAGKVAFRLQECPVFRQGMVRLDLWIWSGRGDVDNLAGGVMDALNGIAWRDDDQIVDLAVHKRPRTKTAPRWMAIVQAATDA